MVFGISHGEPCSCGWGLKGTQNLAEEGLFGFGRRSALTAVTADELVVRGGVGVLAR